MKISLSGRPLLLSKSELCWPPSIDAASHGDGYWMRLDLRADDLDQLLDLAEQMRRHLALDFEEALTLGNILEPHVGRQARRLGGSTVAKVARAVGLRESAYRAYRRPRPHLAAVAGDATLRRRRVKRRA
jgi:hypothetical protein